MGIKISRLCIAAACILLILPQAAKCLTVTSATLEICADDEFYAYINGALVFETQSIAGTDWEHTYTVDVSSFLFCGDYVLAINYYDTLASIINVTYKLTMHIDDGSTRIIYSDGVNEKEMLNGNFLNSTQTFPGGWNNIGFNDAGWTDPIYQCTGARITDTAFASGYVPYDSPYSGCGVPTAGQSVLLRETFNILCPLVNITKTISKTTLALGETFTYCFNYNNTESSPWTFTIWDTIPGPTDFVGCDHGCTTTVNGSNVVVAWPITVPANGSGSVCMWVAANRFPFFRFKDREMTEVASCENRAYIDKREKFAGTGGITQ
jgi:hypothetical protein